MHTRVVVSPMGTSLCCKHKHECRPLAEGASGVAKQIGPPTWLSFLRLPYLPVRMYKDAPELSSGHFGQSGWKTAPHTLSTKSPCVVDTASLHIFNTPAGCSQSFLMELDRIIDTEYLAGGKGLVIGGGWGRQLRPDLVQDLSRCLQQIRAVQGCSKLCGIISDRNESSRSLNQSIRAALTQASHNA